MTHPNPTHYLQDFLEYYSRAKILEDRNHRNGWRKICGDPLQDSVSIYDTVHRKFAGFSNVLRDLHALNRPSDAKGHVEQVVPIPNMVPKWTLREWIYVYGFHRMTGSGASFFPKSEGARRHGYCNAVALDLARMRRVEDMVSYIRDYERPMFTSFGNQPPPFPTPKEPYATGGRYYFCEIWPSIVDQIVDAMPDTPSDRPSVSSMCDWLFDVHVSRGLKKFKFTHTAMVMDLADWHPDLVDPYSECYYGANCLLAMNAMFSEDNRPKGRKFYHTCMAMLVEKCSEILREDACPMDVEDCACDAVRYWNRFVPKYGYEHLAPEQRETLSRISVSEFTRFVANK